MSNKNKKNVKKNNKGLDKDSLIMIILMALMFTVLFGFLIYGAIKKPNQVAVYDDNSIQNLQPITGINTNNDSNNNNNTNNTDDYYETELNEQEININNLKDEDIIPLLKERNDVRRLIKKHGSVLAKNIQYGITGNKASILNMINMYKEGNYEPLKYYYYFNKDSLYIDSGYGEWTAQNNDFYGKYKEGQEEKYYRGFLLYENAFNEMLKSNQKFDIKLNKSEKIIDRYIEDNSYIIITELNGNDYYGEDVYKDNTTFKIKYTVDKEDFSIQKYEIELKEYETITYICEFEYGTEIPNTDKIYNKTHNGDKLRTLTCIDKLNSDKIYELKVPVGIEVVPYIKYGTMTTSDENGEKLFTDENLNNNDKDLRFFINKEEKNTY